MSDLTVERDPRFNLKPCPVPWCRYSQPVIGSAPGVEDRVGQFYIKCQTCSVHTEWIPGKAEAIAAWNQRPGYAVIEAARKVAEAYERFHGAGPEQVNLQVSWLVLMKDEIAELSARVKELEERK